MDDQFLDRYINVFPITRYSSFLPSLTICIFTDLSETRVVAVSISLRSGGLCARHEFMKQRANVLVVVVVTLIRFSYHFIPGVLFMRMFASGLSLKSE